MSEPNEELGTTETLEQALSKNYAALSGESSEEPALPEVGDDTSGETEAEPVQESQDPLEPLEKWTDEQKEYFGQLPRESQQFLLDRHRELESDYTKKTQETAELRKNYERIDKVLEPYRDALDKQGVDITPHLGSALQAYFAYLQNPAETLRTLINQAQLTQDQLFEDESVDPDIRALRAELAEANRKIASLESPKDDSAQRELERFTSAKNDDGTPKYPHFDALRSVMAPMVAEGKSLEEAYEEALWTLPDHRKQQLEAQRKEALKEVNAKRDKKVSEARKASETLPSSDAEPSTGLPKMNGNWEKALQHTLTNLRSD